MKSHKFQLLNFLSTPFVEACQCPLPSFIPSYTSYRRAFFAKTDLLWQPCCGPGVSLKSPRCATLIHCGSVYSFRVRTPNSQNQELHCFAIVILLIANVHDRLDDLPTPPVCSRSVLRKGQIPDTESLKQKLGIPFSTPQPSPTTARRSALKTLRRIRFLLWKGPETRVRLTIKCDSHLRNELSSFPFMSSIYLRALFSCLRNVAVKCLPCPRLRRSASCFDLLLS